MFQITFVVLVLLRIGEVFTCAATSSVGTTTVAIMTTTPPGVTTTTTTTDCQSCDPNIVTFVPADPAIMGSVSATSSDGGLNANGCKQLNAICMGSLGNIAFMQFNGGGGGPAENQNMGQTVTAALVCRSDGQWEYGVDVPREVIMSVNCIETFPGGR